LSSLGENGFFSALLGPPYRHEGFDAAWMVWYILPVYTYRAEGLAMKTARVFKNGQSQAVRLPKEFRFAEDEVYIKKVGNVVLLLPKRDSWDAFVSSLGKFSADFLAEREQPTTQRRRGLSDALHA
jgi:antitoxin VapB